MRIHRLVSHQKFELNDQVARECFRSTIYPILEKYQADRVICKFKVICDNSNNTADMLAQSLPPAVDVYYTELSMDYADPYHISLGGYHPVI